MPRLRLIFRSNFFGLVNSLSPKEIIQHFRPAFSINDIRNPGVFLSDRPAIFPIDFLRRAEYGSVKIQKSLHIPGKSGGAMLLCSEYHFSYDRNGLLRNSQFG